MNGLDGLLKCYDHNESFNTVDEWEGHRAEKSHMFTGKSVCQDCGEKDCEVEFEGKLQPGVQPPAICEPCEDKYIQQLKDKGKIK